MKTETTLSNRNRQLRQGGVMPSCLRLSLKPKWFEMTKEQLSKLHLNQRVSMWQLNRNFEQETKYGYVTKIYNGNHQVQIWFDAEPKPRVVGYTRIELVDVVS